MEDSNKKYVLCLSCIPGKEAVVIQELEFVYKCKAIFAKKQKSIWKNGEWIEQCLPLFRGYLFLYFSDKPDIEKISGHENVLKVLRYSDTEYYLIGRDYEFAEYLFSIDGVIKPLSAVLEGNYVRITDGMLQMYHGRVDSVNKRKRIAKVALDILGETKYAWLSYEILKIYN